jgi:hypothetical protein
MARNMLGELVPRASADSIRQMIGQLDALDRYHDKHGYISPGVERAIVDLRRSLVKALKCREEQLAIDQTIRERRL